uniref:Uncharacterized protein n=1 Tax=Arundo donax TaxID=35708 RepID=A0A0A9FRJ4_ARUDO
MLKRKISRRYLSQGFFSKFFNACMVFAT